MIWVIGNAGMLGQDLCEVLYAKKMKFVGTDREVSILDLDSLRIFAEVHKPSWIINCSAYTAVDQAEVEEEVAYQINRDGVKNIALVASELDIPIIHFSTDYVFDGRSEIPLSEDAPTEPVGVYGRSKLAGENALKENSTKYIIIRTAWLYGKNGPNFVFTMLKLMNKLDSIKVVNDQMGSPTWTIDLVNLAVSIVKQDIGEYGIFHYSGDGHCSWFDFANEIYRLGRKKGLIKSECEVNPCFSIEFPTKANRPAFSLLSKEKVTRSFNYVVNSWKESLNNFIKGINENDII